MILRIARKELTEMARDGRLRWATGIVVSLLLAALAAGWTRYRDVQALTVAAQASARQHWLAQPPRNAHAAAHYGVYAFKPALPLSFVDRGVDPYVGVFAWLEAHKQNDFKYRPAQDGSAVERFGTWTAAAVLQLLVPLVIVMAAFPTFAGEREQGTLGQLLAAGVRTRDLLLGKALGIAAALGTLLVPVALLGAVALALGSEVAALGDTWARVGVLALSYLLYFTVFVAVALAVSARARTARGALVGLLAFWSLNAFLVPRGVTDLARRAHPVPSALEVNLAMERALSATGDGSDARALQDSVLRAHHVSTIDSLPFNFRGLTLERGEEHSYHVFDRTYSALDAAFRSQDRVEHALSALSPLVAVRALSMGLAGTDYPQHRHFAEAAERYRRMLVRTMNGAVSSYAPAGPASAMSSDSTLWASIPPFEYDAPTVAWVLGRYGWALGVLALWAAAAGALALLLARGGSPLARESVR